MKIQIDIINKRAQVVDSPVIVCGNSGYSVAFNFDGEWDSATTKTARFVFIQDGQVKYQDVIFAGTTAEVPVLSNTREVLVGVFAGDLQTTTPARIPCERSILCGTGVPADPTPDQYEQIMELLAAASSKVEYYSTKREEIGVSHENINADYIFGLYDALMAEYPDNVQKNPVYNNDGTFVNYEYVISTVDSYSDDGGYELRDGDDGIKKPKYLVMSGIDGNERLNVFSTYRLVRDILRGHNVPQSFKEGVILHVLPVASPWAFSTLDEDNMPHRFNENTVYIENNFDCEHEYATKTMNGTEYTTGAYGASEKETQAITNWLNANAAADLFISYHNSGGLFEIAVILGDSTNYETDKAKRIALRGVSRVIPFWKNVIGYPSVFEDVLYVYLDEDGKGKQGRGDRDTIFSYSANTRVKGSSILYAQEKLGIPSFIIETPMYYGTYGEYEAKQPVYQPEAIASGAETLGNILIEHYDQALLSEVTDKMNSKLDQILQGMSFRVVKGTYTPSANVSEVNIPGIPANAKAVEIEAVSELSPPDMSGSQSQWVVPVAHISSTVFENSWNESSRNAVVQYYAANQWRYEFTSAAVSSNGWSISLTTGVVLESGKTYEWTAFCWDE